MRYKDSFISQVVGKNYLFCLSALNPNLLSIILFFIISIIKFKIYFPNIKVTSPKPKSISYDLKCWRCVCIPEFKQPYFLFFLHNSTRLVTLTLCLPLIFYLLINFTAFIKTRIFFYSHSRKVYVMSTVGKKGIVGVYRAE